MKNLKRSLTIIVAFAVAFTFMFGSIASVYDDSDAYAASSLSKPKISLRTDGNKITVTWDKVSGAKKYQVAYKLKSAKKWTYKTTKNLKFTVKGKYSKKYKIKVRAISGSLKSKWSRTASRKTAKPQAPTGKTYDLSKLSKLKKYSSFKIGKTYRLKDPMGTGRTKKVTLEYGDIINISGEGVSVSVRGTTSKGFNYEAQASSRAISFTYGKDPIGALNQTDAQTTLNGTGTTTNTSKNAQDEGTTTQPTDPGTGSGTGSGTPAVTLPDLSQINIPGVDLSQIDWSQLDPTKIQLPDLTIPTVPGVQIPTDGTGTGTPQLPDVQLPDASTLPNIPGITDGTGTAGQPAGGQSTLTPRSFDLSMIPMPQTYSVYWTLDDTEPFRGQQDLVNEAGDKVRGKITTLAEMLALRQLQSNSIKPVWIKIFEGKTLVYESYNKTN